MKKIIFAFKIILLAGLLNYCMIFGGCTPNVMLISIDDDTATAREATVENYRIIADIPIGRFNEQIKYSIQIFDAGTDEVFTNNGILLSIERKVRRKYGNNFKNVITLKSELQDSLVDKNIYFHKYNRKGNYQLTFKIESIGGFELQKSINVVTDHEVN